MDDLSFVHVPDEHDEAFRDLVRAWGAAKEDLKKAKQRLKGFLLVHGVRYSGSADWRDAHRRWPSEFTFPQAWSQLAFEEHRRSIEDRPAQCQRLEQVLREAAPAWSYRYTAKVSRIIQLRHEGLPKPVIDRAWDAQLRLCRRFQKLSRQGKHRNVVVTATARERAGFIWDISRIASATA